MWQKNTINNNFLAYKFTNFCIYSIYINICL